MKTNHTEGSAQNRGKRAVAKSGDVAGSGAGAGGGGGAEDYDSDPQAGGGSLVQKPERQTPNTKGDGATGGGR